MLSLNESRFFAMLLNSPTDTRKDRIKSFTLAIILFLFPIFFLIGGLFFVPNHIMTEDYVDASEEVSHLILQEYVSDIEESIEEDMEVSPLFHQTTWAFYIFEEPELTSDIITHLPQQTVEILYEDEEKWFYIQTEQYTGWTRLDSELQFIERKMGLYLQRTDEAPALYLQSQVVSVLERRGNWLQIETNHGPMWLDLDFVPPTSVLDNMLRRLGHTVSVYYENLETGFSYGHNAQQTYFAASVPKAFYAMYLYHLADAGEICLDAELIFTGADFMSGSGVIQYRYPMGTALSTREVIRLNVSYSDNTATLMLRRAHGIADFRNFLIDMGGNPAWIGNCVFAFMISAEEAGLYAREIFRYIEEGSYYSSHLKADLLDNQYPFIISDYPVASKTGWTSFQAWHDMAIVYAPSPYILVILSARGGFSETDHRDFEEISMAFQEFNDLWF